MLLRHVIRFMDRDAAVSNNVQVLALPGESAQERQGWGGNSSTKESSVPFRGGQGCS